EKLLQQLAVLRPVGGAAVASAEDAAFPRPEVLAVLHDDLRRGLLELRRDPVLPEVLRDPAVVEMIVGGIVLVAHHGRLPTQSYLSFSSFLVFLRNSFSRFSLVIRIESSTLMVSRMYIGPPSGSNGQSDANTTLSAPKKSSPHTVAARAPKTAVS